MPARGTLAHALLPHVAPHMRWYTGRVAASFAPTAATPLSDLWQVHIPAWWLTTEPLKLLSYVPMASVLS